MSSIDYNSPALRPVREIVDKRIAELTDKVLSLHTPLDKVTQHRCEIAALTWLSKQLAPPKETSSE
jgi:hypothetical protein